MRVEIYYKAPDSQILDLTDEQEMLWVEYANALDEANDLRGKEGWSRSVMNLFDKADVAYESFVESIQLALYHDLPIDEVTEW